MPRPKRAVFIENLLFWEPLRKQAEGRKSQEIQKWFYSLHTHQFGGRDSNAVK